MVAYGAIMPKRGECSNLLVPVAVSSSHIAFGSIRMEPVFMVLGHSAGAAASMAIAEGVPVQEVDYAKLREQLLAEGQVLQWGDGSLARSISLDADNLEGVVVDDVDAELTGAWKPSVVIGPYVGTGYLHDDNTGQGEKSARFELGVPEPGRYEVRVSYSPTGNRSSRVPIEIYHADGVAQVTLNHSGQGGTHADLTDCLQ